MHLTSAALTFALSSAVWAQDASVPPCSGTAAGAQDCVILSADRVIVFLYQTLPDGALLRITQAGTDGSGLRTSDGIAVKAPNQPPVLHDMTGDGVPELFVPVAAAPSGTHFQIWSAGEDGFLAPYDSVTAARPEQFEPLDGLVRFVGGSDGEVQIESIYVWEPDGLRLLYALSANADTGECSMITGRALFHQDVILADCEDRLAQTTTQGEN